MNVFSNFFVEPFLQTKR